MRADPQQVAIQNLRCDRSEDYVVLARLQIRLLAALSKEIPTDDDRPPENPLGVLEWSYPNLGELIRGRSVLDLGCGFGDQAAAMKRKYGCQVTGVDTDEMYLKEAVRRYGQECEFLGNVPDQRQWDVVVSINAMEHYPDPGGVLSLMMSAVRPGGRVLITFGPLWWAPYGSHTSYFCRIPWLQLWFTERAIMTVRSKYRDDGAMRFEDCRAGLNRMSVRKFERLIRNYNARTRYVAVKRMQILTHIPILRELFTNQAICEITRDPHFSQVQA